MVLPSCIPGIVASLLWDRCTATAASASAIIGCVIGTSVWVRYPIYHHIPGGITIDNLTFYPLGLMFGKQQYIWAEATYFGARQLQKTATEMLLSPYPEI